MPKQPPPVVPELAADESDYTSQWMGPLRAPTDSILADKGGDWRVYEDLLTDDQVQSTFQQRRLAVLANPWEIQPGDDTPAAKEAADGLTEALAGVDIDRITDKMLFGVWYGHAIGECIWRPTATLVTLADIRVRQRQRFRYGAKAGELYLITAKSPNGVLMPPNKFWSYHTGADHDDEPYGRGLAHWCYWPVFFKRNDIRFWLTFLEKFGMPTATAEVPAAMLKNPELKTKILEALQAIQTDTAVLLPDGVAITLLEAARSGTADYATLKLQMDAAIAKIVLSQTMTTDQGSSLSQAQVHMEVREEVVTADTRLITESFRSTVAKWLTVWNFGDTGDGFTPRVPVPLLIRDSTPPDDLEARAKRDSTIYDLGYAPTPEYIAEHYGDGFVPRQMPDPMAAALPPAARAEFAELISTAGNRDDQAKIVAGALALANKWESIMGPRVRQLAQYLESTEDLPTFRRRLNELLAEGPPSEVVDTFHRASVTSRLLGMFRGERGTA